MDKPTYLGLAVFELSKLLMYEIYYDNLQSYFGEKNIQLLYMDPDSFISGVTFSENIKDLQNFNDLFDFSNLKKNHELYSIKNKKVVGKFKIETPKNVFEDELICLISKAYAFICGSDNKTKLKGTSKSQSKNIQFVEYYNCLFGGEYQKNVIII